jgi:hypothetical protein
MRLGTRLKRSEFNVGGEKERNRQSRDHILDYSAKLRYHSSPFWHKPGLAGLQVSTEYSVVSTEYGVFGLALPYNWHYSLSFLVT